MSTFPLSLRLDVEGAPSGSAVVAVRVVSSSPSPLNRLIFDALVRVAKPGKKFCTPLYWGCLPRKDGLFSRVVGLITRPSKIVVAGPSAEASFVAGVELALSKHNVQGGGVAVRIFVRDFDYQSQKSGITELSIRSNLPRAARLLGWDREVLLPVVLDALPSVLEFSDEEG